MKTCTRCKAEKQLTDFNKNKAKKDGLHDCCRTCKAFYNAAYREKNKESAALYRLNNAERANVYRRKYKELNPNKGNQWRLENKEKAAASTKAYRKANPEKISARNRNLRAVKRSAEGKHSAADVRNIFTAQRGLCANCKTKLFKSGKKIMHVDHIVPLARGGANDKYNLQCLCPACNLRKSAKDPINWANENGRLL